MQQRCNSKIDWQPFLVPRYEVLSTSIYKAPTLIYVLQTMSSRVVSWQTFPDLSSSAWNHLQWFRAGLLKLWVATPFGVAKCNFGFAKQIWLTKQIQKFLWTWQ